MKKSELAMPLGFCPQCLGTLARGCFRGLVIKMRGGYPAIAGGWCPHNEVVAIRLEISDQEVGPWRMISPAIEEDLAEMMQRAAGFDGASKPMAAELH